MVHLAGQDHLDAHPRVNYFAIFIALCICTAISVALDIVEITPLLLVALVLAVAMAKALFVLTYFMHLKFEGRWKFIILAPTAILAVGLMVALAPDVAMHYYTNEAPQARAAQAVEEGLNPPPPQGESEQMAPGDAAH
ncbi:cytochrome C oxidase subunit IV family protein [Planctomicrobium sp. SH661]|uniref:cytochrome C oxidase subunit IV family protein n=1 Tax=Planctomicrobium sp. SH661 TaxID=3448124 RepID=UPI003F5C3507